jgi:coenzyme Q-binding protein COQ10
MSPYAERQHLPYAAPQLFDLVASVERYPEFMPWVTEAHIRHRRDRTIVVAMTVGVGPLRKRFSTIATLDRPHRIDIASYDSTFERFEQRWTFEPTAEGGTNVEYHVVFEFRSRVLQKLMGAQLPDQAIATMTAFKRRAHRLYRGQPERCIENDNGPGNP